MVVAAWSVVAHADDKKRIAQIKAAIDVQAKAIVAGDEKAFVSTGTDNLVYGLVEHPLDTNSFQVDLIGVDKIDFATTSIGWSGTFGWAVADVRWYPQPYPEGMKPGDPNHQYTEWNTRRWIAMFVADGDDAVKLRAMRLDPTRDDKNLYGSGDAPLGKARTDLSPMLTFLIQPTLASKALGSDPNVAVYGTAPGDRGVGPKAAKRLLASWTKLTLEISDSSYAHPVELSGGDGVIVDARIRMKSGKYWVPINATAIGHKVGDRWELDALVYGYGTGS